MHKKFDHQAIEKKWQEKWKADGLYDVGERDQDIEKEYVLVEWPYPSGNLHIGHWHAFAVPDIYVRAHRMQGKQVIFPMGFDAFGLPAENAAIKRNINPREWTESNVEYMTNQLNAMGNAFTWNKTTSSTDPEYFRWTQWMFNQFFKNDIAYRGIGTVNWCPSCNTVLANEQVLADDTCERCGAEVEKKEMEEWKMRITKYADRLVDDLEKINWPEHIKESQRQWIGRSEGSEITFQLNMGDKIDTIAFASNNEGKIKRMRLLLKEAGLAIDLKTPKELGIENFDVEEDRATIEENSLKKAKALSELCDLPVLADDSGFFIHGAEIDPVKVKRNALEGKSESDLSVEEISELMQNYYKNIANEHGGSIDAEWQNALTVIDSDGNTVQTIAIRPVTLTNEIHGQPDPYLPLRSLYIAKDTGKYVLEHTDAEELIELQPITDGLKKILDPSLTVFTTRPDTLFGATYMVLAPEHELLEKHKSAITNWNEVASYISESAKKSEIDRTNADKEKTGVKLEGITATNPANGEEIPIYIADYVLVGYGTGAIMAVPAHDERDYEFAKKYDIPVRQVVSGDEQLPFATKGNLINSGAFNGTDSEEAKHAITEKVGGSIANTYRLRDWSIGRQRYWGVPIPIAYDKEGTPHPIPDEHLPWHLPTDVDFKPTGEPPLAKSKELKERVEKIFGEGWTPAVETMDTFVDSSSYFLRYIDNKNDDEYSSLKVQKDWMPIDIYFGGAEHTTMHLLYSRFWQKVLYDLKLAEHDEPYTKRINRGLVLGPDGNKMSKSKGNVIDPDDQVTRLGADTVKMYLAFMGPYGEVSNYPWDMGGIAGLRRFLERVYGLTEHISEAENVDVTRQLHKTIKKVTEDIDNYKFNTAISSLMVFVNLVEKEGLSKESYLTFLKLMAAFAPHLAEELWNQNSVSSSIHQETWPTYDAKLAKDQEVTLGVQINGKMRGKLVLSPEASEDEAVAAVKADQKLSERLTGEITKIIYVPGRIINVIQKE